MQGGQNWADTALEVGVLKASNCRENVEIIPVAFIGGRLKIKMVGLFYSKLAVLNRFYVQLYFAFHCHHRFRGPKGQMIITITSPIIKKGNYVEFCSYMRKFLF